MSWVPSPSTARHLFYGILIGFSLSFATTSTITAYRKREEDGATMRVSPRPIELRSDEVLDGVTGLIGACPSSVGIRVHVRRLTEWFSHTLQETLRWFGSTRLAMRWVSRFLARLRCVSAAKLRTLCGVVSPLRTNAFVVPQPGGQRKGPCRTQKYVRYDIYRALLPVDCSPLK